MFATGLENVVGLPWNFQFHIGLVPNSRERGIQALLERDLFDIVDVHNMHFDVFVVFCVFQFLKGIGDLLLSRGLVGSGMFKMSFCLFKVTDGFRYGAPVCTENLNTGVVVMKSAQDGA